MNLIRHYIGSLVVIALLTSLISMAYADIKDQYGFTETYEGGDGNGNIAERIESMGLVTSINTFTDGVLKLANPNTPADIIGGLMSSAIGALGLLFGTFLLPIEIFGVITGFYYIPPPVSIAVGMIVLVYLTFIYLSAKLRGDV